MLRQNVLAFRFLSFWSLTFGPCDMALPFQPPDANGQHQRVFILGGWKSLRLMLRRLVVATCNGGGGNPCEKKNGQTSRFKTLVFHNCWGHFLGTRSWPLGLGWGWCSYSYDLCQQFSSWKTSDIWICLWKTSNIWICFWRTSDIWICFTQKL